MIEEEYVNSLENRFLECGFQTFREVIPLECINWKNPFRVDLIVYRKDVGYMGIEAKRIDSFDKGGVIAKATEQIKKYRDKSYFEGIKIKKWAIAIPLKPIDSEPGTRINSFVQHFLGFYAIEVLFLGEDRISISPYTQNSKYFYKDGREVNFR